MEKENKLTAEQDTTDNKVVELKDDDLETITAGSGTPNNGYDENKQAIKFDFLCGSVTHNNGCDKKSAGKISCYPKY